MTLLAPTPASPTSPFSGSNLLNDGASLTAAMKNGDWLDGGIAFLQGLGDAAAAATDPLGTIAKCGLGWVMSHLAPLSTWLNQLAGSQESVLGVAGQWTSAGGTMRTAGSTLQTRLKDLDGMQGQTVTAYVAFAKDAATHLRASGDWADGIANGLSSASELVAKMQSVVKSAISSVIATAIEAMAVVAASFGLGMGYAIARVVTKVNEMVNKVAKPILSVLKSVKSLVTMVQSFQQLFDGTNSLVSTMLENQPVTIPLAATTVVDASGATFLGSTGAANLELAGTEADGRIGGILDGVSVDGPIAGGTLHLGGADAGTAVGSAGGGSVTLGATGGVGSLNSSAGVAGGLVGGSALAAARVTGVTTPGGPGAGGSMMAAGRTATGPAEGMGSRGRRARRLTVDIIPADDETLPDDES